MMDCSVLAKIHMVTKLLHLDSLASLRSVLAKIHMVTKLQRTRNERHLRSVLAKIHMVTKPQIHNTILIDLRYK